MAAPDIPRSPKTPLTLVIAGQTASGKSGTALVLAEKLGGEIVNADSRQIYLYLDAGTAKPSREDRRRRPHHLYDFLDPKETYSAAAYARDARRVLEDILARGKTPIVVGGTGLYLKALFEGMAAMPGRNEAVRRDLAALAERKGREFLHAALQKADPASAEKIPPQNIQRVIRALEVFQTTGKPLSWWHAHSPRPAPALNAAFFALNWPRETLKKRIALRCEKILPALIEEARGLLERGYRASDPGLESLGYKNAVAHLEGRMTRGELQDSLLLDTLHYAKRQATWFRRDPKIQWLDAGEDFTPEKAARHILALVI